MVTLLHSDGRKWKRAGHRSAERARVWPPWPSGVIRRLSTQEEEWARAMARGLLGTRIDELVYISRCSKYEDSISNSLEGSQIGARSESNQSTWHPLKAENKRPWPFIFALFSRHAIPFRHAMLSLVMRIPILSEKHLQCGGRQSILISPKDNICCHRHHDVFVFCLSLPASDISKAGDLKWHWGRTP